MSLSKGNKRGQLSSLILCLFIIVPLELHLVKLVLNIAYLCHKLMEIYLNIGHVDFLANVRMLKVGSELRYGIRSPNVRTPVDIPSKYICQSLNHVLAKVYISPRSTLSI